MLDFGEGRHLTFTVSTQTVPYQRVQIFGTKGRLEVEIPFNAPQGGAMQLWLDDGKKFADASAKLIKIDKADQYQLQGEYFSRVVRGKEKFAYGVDDAIQQARVLDAVFRSADPASGRSRRRLDWRERRRLRRRGLPVPARRGSRGRRLRR